MRKIRAWFHKWFLEDTRHDHDWSGVDRRGRTVCAVCREHRAHHIEHRSYYIEYR